jgi:hypothetical protein
MTNLDRDLHNADWVKRSWDLPTDPDFWINTEPDLQAFLYEMDHLPVGKAMPKDLRVALEAHVLRTSPTKTNFAKTIHALTMFLESKIIRHVRDSDYWGKPVGTVITPGMKPVGIRNATPTIASPRPHRLVRRKPVRTRGVVDAADATASVFDSNEAFDRQAARHLKKPRKPRSKPTPTQYGHFEAGQAKASVVGAIADDLAKLPNDKQDFMLDLAGCMESYGNVWNRDQSIDTLTEQMMSRAETRRLLEDDRELWEIQRIIDRLEWNDDELPLAKRTREIRAAKKARQERRATLIKQSGTARKIIAQAIVDAWAESAASPMSLDLMDAAADIGLSDRRVPLEGKPPNKYWGSRTINRRWTKGIDSTHRLQTQEIFREVAHSIYQRTQAEFKDDKVTSVTLARGTGDDYLSNVVLEMSPWMDYDEESGQFEMLPEIEIAIDELIAKGTAADASPDITAWDDEISYSLMELAQAIERSSRGLRKPSQAARLDNYLLETEAGSSKSPTTVIDTLLDELISAGLQLHDIVPGGRQAVRDQEKAAEKASIEIDADLRTLSSWAVLPSEAEKFGDAGIVIQSTFPVERIFSTALTGPGCLDEHEMLVLGLDEPETMAVRPNGGSDINPAVEQNAELALAIAKHVLGRILSDKQAAKATGLTPQQLQKLRKAVREGRGRVTDESRAIAELLTNSW